MSDLFIYATFGDRENAYEVAHSVVQDRLAAAAHIFPPIESTYEWGDDIDEGQEVVVIFKTRGELYDDAQDLICALHNYEMPCVVPLSAAKGCGPFMSWIEPEASVEAVDDRQDA